MTDLSIVIISGLSGAGKSNAAKVLEDMGYNTIDNIPLQVVEKIVELFHGLDKGNSKVAFVIDSRSKDSSLAYSTIKMLKEKYNASLLFMDASLETLVKRYKETRRKHPQGDDIVEAIQNEITLMSDIKDVADIVFNSDGKSVHDLAREIQGYFKDYVTMDLKIMVQSFGFKYGFPGEADMMFDARFLRNPFFEDKLKHLTGLNKEVSDYVRDDENYGEFLAKVEDLVSMLIPLYAKEGKKYFIISVGCTGGKHRSVTVVEDLAAYLNKSGKLLVRVKHRDIDKD